MKEGQELITESGHKIIYDIVSGDDNYIVFLSGLMSDRLGSKATYLKEFCKKQGYSYICFDYLGHGDSDLKFTECTINTWLSNTQEILNKLVPNKAILVGSSLGGWLSLRAAELDARKIKAIVGLAAAPDFTEDLMWDIFSLEVKELLESGEIYNLPSDYCDGNYPITMELIKSGRENLLLRKEKIDVDFPVRLFQGMKDDDVPYQYAIKIAENLVSEDVEVNLIKDGDHRLSTDEQLANIATTVTHLIEN